MATKVNPRKPCFLPALLWTAVFLLLLVGIDQLLVRVPASLPAHVAVTAFYRDLRGRALALAHRGEAPPASAPAHPATRAPGSVEAVISQRQSPSATPAAKAPHEPAPRYVYADDRGELHFAATLAEIPAPFRDQARQLRE